MSENVSMGELRETRKGKRTVGVREETVFEGNDNELTALEAGAKEATDVLSCEGRRG